MSDVWYYANQGGHVGPFSLQQLKLTLPTMANPGDVLVWCPKFRGWKKAGDVSELWDEPASPSPMRVPQNTIETKDKPSFLRKPKWEWFVLALPLLGSAASHVGREEMSRLSQDRVISKEAKRWLNEGPPDMVIGFARAIRSKLLFILLALTCVAYGTFHGLLLGSPLSGLIAGILSAAILYIAIVTARKYRVKKPTSLLIWIGNIAYWLGWALAFYGLFLMVNQISHAGLSGGVRAASSLLPSVIFYPAVGWGVRYMLGRR
jgi:GYF domain 2